MRFKKSKKNFLLIFFFKFYYLTIKKLRKNENRSINRVVQLIVLNATLGIILKSLMTIRPIYTIKNQIEFIFMNLKNFPMPDIHFKSRVRICQSDYVCTTIDSIGRNLFIVNLAIPFFFFYKFDYRFKECFQNLTTNIKKKLSIQKK